MGVPSEGWRGLGLEGYTPEYFGRSDYSLFPLWLEANQNPQDRPRKR